MYFLFAYNSGDVTGWNTACMGTYKREGNAKNAAENYQHKDFCFILDGESGEISDGKPITWDTRVRAQTKQNAMELIADRLKFLASNGSTDTQMQEVETFAKENTIPFSADMYKMFIDKVELVEEEDEYDWDNSGCSWDTSGC